jgi:hypothetical protein
LCSHPKTFGWGLVLPHLCRCYDVDPAINVVQPLRNVRRSSFLLSCLCSVVSWYILEYGYLMDTLDIATSLVSILIWMDTATHLVLHTKMRHFVASFSRCGNCWRVIQFTDVSRNLGQGNFPACDIYPPDLEIDHSLHEFGQ